MTDLETTRVAVVSGAARGIGDAICQALHLDGWVTVGIDLDRADGSTRAVVGDVTSEATWAEALVQAQSLGVLSGVVNNAGFQGPSSVLADVALEDHLRVMDVNVTSAFLGTRLGMRNLVEGGAVDE